MLYRSLRGNFGVFSGELRFSDGFNVICAGNESGKSTSCAFLRAMLYGVRSSERERADHLPDKLKYLPWDGRPMSGALTLEQDGRPLVLTRASDHGAPLRDFSAVWADTGSPASGLNGSNAGETLCGVSADVFERTVFCSADSLAVKNSAELEARLAAAAGSGDETVSAAAADAVLAAWQRQRRYNRRGELPAAEERAASLRSRVAEVEEQNARILDTAARIRELAAKKAVVDEELAVAEAHRAAEDRKRSDGLRDELARAEEDARAFAETHRLSGARADAGAVSDAEAAFRTAAGLEAERRAKESLLYRLSRENESGGVPEEFRFFGGCHPDSAVELARTESARCRRLLSARPKYWLFAAAALLAAAGVLLLTLCDRSDLMVRVPAEACFGGALLLLVLAVAGTVSALKGKKEARAVCARWGCGDPGRFPDVARGYVLYCRDADARRGELAALEDELGDIDDRLQFLRRSTQSAARELGLDPADPARDAAHLKALLDEYAKKREKCRILSETAANLAASPAPEAPIRAPRLPESDLRAAEAALSASLREAELSMERMRGEVSRLGDLGELKSRLAETEAEIARLTDEYDALELARELTAACGEELSRDLTPRIAARAEEIFTALTDGRYGELHLTRELEASAVPAGEAVARRLLSLSRGAADQAWLSVRLALSELAVPDPTVPLLLDDVLAMYDDGRARLALTFLAEAARSRQIILFTCRERDARLAEALGAAVQRL